MDFKINAAALFNLNILFLLCNIVAEKPADRRVMIANYTDSDLRSVVLILGNICRVIP